MYTNIEVFRSIALEALQASREATDADRRPRTDGEGFILSLDPAQTSFKQSLIAIAFAGVYLEALLFIEGSRILGREVYLSLDREYELRLKRIAVVSDDLLDRCEAFRKARNELMHEKASSESRKEVIRFAQEEAEKAIVLVRDVATALKRPWPKQ